MNLYFALIGFFNSLAAALTGLYIFLRNRASPLYRSYFLFAMSVALWSGFYGIWQIQSAEGPALFFMRLTMIPCYTIPFAFLWFVLNLTEADRKKIYLSFCLAIPAFF